MADVLTAPVFAGWNVWSVYQTNDAGDFDPFMWGLDMNQRLKIWVEDAVREGAPLAQVADPVALKGSMVEVLAGPPTLSVQARKEDVAGPAMLVNGQATLKYVRFFNRGAPGSLAWPHDGSYLLNEVFKPDPKNEATNAPAPTTILGGAQHALEGAADTALTVVEVAGGIVAVLLGFKYLFSRRDK